MVEKEKKNQKRRATSPAMRTPQAMESQLINLAMNRAKEQLENGTASSQIITYFLKLGASIMDYQKEKLKADAELARAKVEAIESQRRSEELYENALSAFRSYSSDFQEEEDSGEYE